MITIEFKKQKELEHIFEAMSQLQCLIVGTLSLERMWQLFLYSTKEWPRDIQISVRDAMELIWDRIFIDNINQEKLILYNNIISMIDGFLCKNDIPNNYGRFHNYLINELSSGTALFFGKYTNSRCAGSAISAAYLIHDKIGNDFSRVNDQELAEILSQHPLMLAELGRIDHDIHFVKTELISKVRLSTLIEEYRNTWIVPCD